MTSRDFVYWMQGLFELDAPKALDERQTDLIKRHLAMVFIHEIDPSMGGPEHQQKLTEAHGGRVFEFEDGGGYQEVTDSARKKEIVEKHEWHPLTVDPTTVPKFSQAELDRLAAEGRELGRELDRRMRGSGLTYTRDPKFAPVATDDPVSVETRVLFQPMWNPPKFNC
jgi:hypothetical protein